MDQRYWLFEYGKVLLAYGFIMYLWPSVVFRPHLSGKSGAYRFCFCVNGSLLLINTLVLLLGLVRLLNQTLVAVLFWGVFALQLYRNFPVGFSWLADVRSMLNKTMTVRRMLLKWHTGNRRHLAAAAGKCWRAAENRRWEYAILCLVTLFAMAYFSANALQVHSYGFGDQYVHHAWVYGLSQGKIFSAGIYPEGMHCFIYLMGTVFPIKYYSIVLFLAGIHIQVYVIAAYLLGRTLFRWSMSGLFALVGFLTVEQAVVNGVFGVSRLSWTLPQEFALYTVFLTVYGLIGFLRCKPQPFSGRFRFFRAASWKEYFSDENLVIFISSAAASLCIHFYATILALFVCLVAVCVNLRRFFRRERVTRLVAGALIALSVAALPMALAGLEGYRLQGSLYWAMSVTKDSAGARTDTDKQPAEAGTSSRKSFPEKVTGAVRGTFFELYGEKRGRLLLWLDLSVIGVTSLLLVVKLAGRARKKEKKPHETQLIRLLKSYLFIALSVFALFLAYRPGLLGLPSLVEGTRVCSTIDLFAMLLYACVPDLLFTAAGLLVKEQWLRPASALLCAGVYLIVQAAGIFHGYPYYELTRYPVAVELTKEIVARVPAYQYTIISTTDELYQVIETGFHEEWIDFLEKNGDESYTIPTPYLFFFIEKHPIRYAQNCFASGPRWLAEEKYARLYRGIGAQYPDILHGQVSEEAAEMDFSGINKRSDSASSLTSRTILESRAYLWYQQFSALHPHEGKVIYEDDDFLCYCVHQNEFSLFSLGVGDG